MNSQDAMRRLRAARPAAAEPVHNDALFARIISEPGDPRLGLGRSPRRRLRLAAFTRPRVLAGGSLGVAGVAVAAVLALSGGAAVSGGAAGPAFAAVSRQTNGTVLVHLSDARAIVSADEQLVQMGIKEQVMYQTAPGAATSSAPVACKLVLGPGDYSAAPTSAGPPVEMRLGSDNTTVIPSSGPENSGTPGGTVHLSSCVSYPEGPGTQLGNSGQKFLQTYGG